MTARREIVPGFVSIAPMIDKTDRHFRHFLRLLTKEAILYTEMVTTGAVIHGDRSRILDFDPAEGPVVLQLGADNPEELYRAVQICEDWGYDEYNLNVGCPSDKVQKGNFGACLMADPPRVRELMEAMASATAKPVGIKHRVGITSANVDRTSYGELAEFLAEVSRAPVDRCIVHARIAILEGLSPKENRTVPPLRYEDVWQLKRDFPSLHMEINGNIQTLEEMRMHRDKGMDGVMIGRMSYENPWELSRVDGGFTGEVPVRKDEDEGGDDLARRFHVARVHAAYIDEMAARGLHPRSLVWPLLELFPGMRGSRRYKQVLSGTIPRGTRVSRLMEEALAHVLQGQEMR